MSKIANQCRIMRQQLQPYVLQQEQRKHQKEQDHQKWQERAVKTTLCSLYRKLTEKVYSGCGDNFYSPVFVHDNFLNYDYIHDTILNTYGLDLIIPDCNSDSYIQIAPDSKIKCCTVTLGQTSESLELDFPKLLHEDQRRAQAWSTCLPTLAKQIVIICEKHLKSMPNKFYGIPFSLNIVDTNNHNAFYNKSFRLDNFEVKFDDLNTKQRAELQSAMRQLVSRATIKITTSSANIYSETFWITFYKKPEKTIDNPYFNYAEFYQKYEKVTPQLQKHFDYITKHVTMPTPESQFLTLTPELKLFYHFSNEAGPNWELMHQRFTDSSNSTLLQSLSDHFEASFNGIRITKIEFKYNQHSCFSPRGCGPHGYITDQRIECTYEIIAPDCEIADLASKTYQEINYIKSERHCRAARELIKHILASVNQSLQKGRGALLLQETNTSNALSDTDLIVTIDQHFVNLNQVADQDFLKRVSNAVYEQSHKLISVNLTRSGEKYFQLHP